MANCKNCGTPYNYIYDTCPSCRGVKRPDNPLDHIDDGIDLNQEEDLIQEEIQERMQRENPPKNHKRKRPEKRKNLKSNQ
jgi:hypothetical protein